VPTEDAIRALRAAELPLLEAQAYLDHATVGPIPLRHVRAATEVLERLGAGGPTASEGTRLLEAARGVAAGLLRTEPGRIALLRSTSEGLGLVAGGLDWRDGDEVVLYERDFVGCLAPFLRLRDRGVRIRWIPDRSDRFDLADVEALLTPRTRAVCVSVVNRSHGMRAPVEELGALCRERGIWLALDAAQAMGVLDLDAERIGADVIAAHGYKFLCSGFGLAVVCCSERAVDELDVPLIGWKNAALGREHELALVPAGAARRFEPTMSSLPALAGLGASLGLLNELEPGERERRAIRLATVAAEGLAEAGYEVAGAKRTAERSTLVAARREGVDPERVAGALRAEGIACCAVDGVLRVSVHAFNTADDVERLLEAVPRAERSARR
jgi:cysteine desulfurase/selenocysteine lyase